MTVSDGFIAMLEELLEPLGPITSRRMFGGAGVYCGPVIFGLVVDDALYLKADGATQARFEAEGMQPFTYDGKGKPIRMSYWRVPERLLDEPDELLVWSRQALGVAMSAAKPKSGAKAVQKLRPPGTTSKNAARAKGTTRR